MIRLSTKRLLATATVGVALALAAIATPTPSSAQPYGYWRGYGGPYAEQYRWRAFRGSTCDFRTFSRDRQVNGTC